MSAVYSHGMCIIRLRVNHLGTCKEKVMMSVVCFVVVVFFFFFIY